VGIPQLFKGTPRAVPDTAWRNHLETRGAARDGAAAHHVPCEECHGLTAGSHTDSSRGDGGLRGMSGPGAPLCHGATVLRLDGQHSGSPHSDASQRRRTITGKHPLREKLALVAGNAPVTDQVLQISQER
jgi:hypothetical protein